MLILAKAGPPIGHLPSIDGGCPSRDARWPIASTAVALVLLLLLGREGPWIRMIFDDKRREF